MAALQVPIGPRDRDGVRIARIEIHQFDRFHDKDDCSALS